MSTGPGIRAGWTPARCQLRREHLQTSLFRTRALADLRPTSAGRLACGDYRLRPALCGDHRPIRTGDLGGMKEAGGRLRPVWQQNMAICRHFTGATGLEPATSGVTGRSWYVRAGPE